ncbi:sensor histidine kinase [Clostridium fungisolvens]|uniref:histidine kinase n=1 Tax=Clostridium fungisolvens TaxID=1604897 RepID=A0A6V8SIU8_9CLOT|nr:MASE3 domain-containing protein [Clostridium fungisolvens]GFP76656.1 Sensor histidine kinase RcsC [Clostridium fungisolvens]
MSVGDKMIKTAKYIGKSTTDFSIKNEVIKSLLLIILSICISQKLIEADYMFYHSILMFIGIIICFAIYFFASNTYRFSNNDFCMLLGMGFLTVGTIDILHTVAYFNVGIFGLNSANLSSSLWISASYIGSITILISSIFLYRGIKKININIFRFIYIIALATIILSIYVFKIFPISYIEGIGNTLFNQASRVIIIIILFISGIILYKASNKDNRELIFFMELSIIFTIINKILLLLFDYTLCIENTSAFVFRTISFYMLYKGVVQCGLKQPFNKVTGALIETKDKLLQESDLRIMFEEAMVNNEECYRILIENSSDAIVIHSDYKHVFANETAAKMLGFSKAQDLMKADFSKFIEEENFNSSMEIYNEILTKRRNGDAYDTTLITIDGRKISVKIQGTYIIYRGKPSVLIVFKDLSTEKKVEKLSADIEEKGKMLEDTIFLNKRITEHFANVSHELRTPLNVILGAIQILGLYDSHDSMLNSIDKIQAYYKTIKQNCYRLLRLVNNLIDLSKIDSGFFELKKRNGNIVEVIEGITMSIVSYCETKNITLIFDTEVEEKYMAFDHDKIERIMLNLLSNAIKFTNEGGTIFVYIEDVGKEISIIVKDSGVGIDEKHQELIFERYRQADNNLLNFVQGTGIGLSLVKALVELHKGLIHVKSKLGEGTEFYITLPVEVLDTNQEEHKETEVRSNVERISIEFSDIYS